MATNSIPRAVAGERGCGDARQEGGVYIEVGMSPSGMPLEHFLIDSPWKLPEGWGANELANKATLQQDATGVWHIIIWVGANFYPYAPDYIEETRHMGVSRHIPRNFEFEKISRDTTLIFVHSKAYITNWLSLTPPTLCRKHKRYHVAGHVCTCPSSTTEDIHPAIVNRMPIPVRRGPCLFKTYYTIPQNEGSPADNKMYLRKIGGSAYFYKPTHEEAHYRPAIFMRMRPTGIAIIEDEAGHVDPHVMDRAGRAGIPVFQSKS